MSDPIHAFRRLVLLADEPSVPQLSREQLRAQKTRADQLTPDDVTGWLDLYTQAHASGLALADDLQSEGEGAGVQPEHAVDCSNERQQAARRVQHYMREFDRADLEAFNYVSTDRVPRQREGPVQKLIGNLKAGLHPLESSEGATITIALADTERDYCSKKLAGDLYDWQRQAVEGTIARAHNNRAQFLEHLEDAFIQLNIERPPLPEYLDAGTPEHLPLPESRSAERIGFFSAALKMFRSFYGIVMMISAILVPILMSTVGKDNIDYETRNMVVALMFSVLLILAAILAHKKRDKERQALVDRLQHELMLECDKVLNRNADAMKKHIQTIIKKIQKQHERAMTSWRFDLEQRLESARSLHAATPVCAKGFDPMQSRKRTICNQLAERTLPAISQRIAELRAG